MTTIATDGRSMAADGRMTSGGEILTEKAQKITRLPDGSLLGMSGNVDAAKAAAHSIAKSIEEDSFPLPLQTSDSFRLLRLLTNGKVLLYDGPFLVPDEVSVPASVGSGGEYARGAMLAGASPRQAVAIAHKVDNQTGPVRLNLSVRP